MFYYINIQSFEGCDEQTIVSTDIERNITTVSNPGLVLIPEPIDTLLTLHGQFFASATLAALLKGMEFIKVEEKPVARVHLRSHWDWETFTKIKDDPIYYQVYFMGIPCQDDFGVANHYDLVVSEPGLNVLREGGVVTAPSDLITQNCQIYFEAYCNLFWMPEPGRSAYIKMLEQRKGK